MTFISANKPRFQSIADEMNIIYAVESIVNLIKGNTVNIVFDTLIEYPVSELSLESQVSLIEKNYICERVSARIQLNETYSRIRKAFLKGIPGKELHEVPIYDNGMYGGECMIDGYSFSLMNKKTNSSP